MASSQSPQHSYFTSIYIQPQKPLFCISSHTHTPPKSSSSSMDSPTALLFLLLLPPLHFLLCNLPTVGAAPPEKLFREYIGAEGNNVTFTDVPISPAVDFHFLLSFAIDYTDGSHPTPTNGDFRVYWDTANLSPSQVSAIKAKHANVRVGMSLGGDTTNSKQQVFFHPTSVNSWVANAIHSITDIVTTYNLDGIDIDYEHFDSDTDTFAECIGKLLFYLKQNKIISFASIAPYEDKSVKPYYLALWRKYGNLIDYVNFQFYAYPKGTTVSQFLKYFDEQSSNYKGGKVLVSFGTDGSGGLSPKNGFFEACSTLSKQGKLHGIFIWSADDSKKANFKYEKQSQDFLATQK
ncbi:chitinase 2-like [Salvia miltiorrhiza]|uniref:chitinase 2-like n=1 Tax=Salvia miltiorrhiza TaxID=226208 RepID=UPI0025AB7E51|nr:chitinase 2-like [Salvia miltiorrhiza]